MIIVHYLNNSRAHRILWLLEELGLSYEVKIYQRGADMRAPASLKAVHPLGKSPVIEDQGRIIAESGAIIEYLVETYGEGKGLKPAAGTDEALRYRYWLHYAEGSAMPLLLLKLLFLRLPSQLPFFLRPVASLIATGVQAKLVDPQLADHLAFWNGELARGGWFAGSAFTGADIAMSFPVEAGMTRMKSMGDVRAVRRYLDAIRARPAYRRALEKGGQYDYATS
ncbi:glutathione S-transferase family protein [Affinirhizobium pseudoryzae]|uniref:glutathione S-transferase family protein n=1 Tax=Allorhizobium pseudoryzae TaxID=379684 RepID=UPI0013EDF97E|nr:glutathione S-transferase [Allorhizobium pseudoryzae]